MNPSLNSRARKSLKRILASEQSVCNEFQGGEVQVGRAFGQIGHFDGDDLVGIVVVEDDAGRGFFGFDDGGVVKAEVEGVGFFVDV